MERFRSAEMVASSSGWNPIGVLIVLVLAPLVVLLGLVVVLDWRGLGTKYYKLTCRTDIFGWYERGGYARFRVWAGWYPVAFGGLMFILGIVGLASLA